VYGDQAYRGQRAVICEHAPNARDFTNRRYRHGGVVDEVERGKNRTKSAVRAKVEHPFGVIKRVFGLVKVRYRGLAKNTERLWCISYDLIRRSVLAVRAVVSVVDGHAAMSFSFAKGSASIRVWIGVLP
jgi:Transposase DDE domain